MSKTYKIIELTGWRAAFFLACLWLSGFTLGLLCGAALVLLTE